MVISIENSVLNVTSAETPYSGSQDYHSISFEFDSEWDDYTKIAVFINEAGGISEVTVPVDGIVAIPVEMLEDKAVIQVGCYGINGDIRKTSALYKLQIEEGSYKVGESAMPTPDLFAQYLSLTTAQADRAETAADDAEAAAAEAEATLANKANLIDGKVPQSELPAYVDDVLEYADFASFPATGETGKVYIAIDTNKSYRWSGSIYVELAGGVVLGTTSETAYRGDRGQTAYNHSQLVSGNPHGVTKSDVGLGNVDNTSDTDKPVSSAQQAALDALTKSDVGLGNVDNTSDTDKPVSTAQATAISAATGALTKSDVGLGNVDNTSDVDKPVSTAQAAAFAPISGGDYITAGKTLALADAFLFIRCDASSGITITIPTNASVAFALNTDITIFKEGAGDITIVGDTGVTVLSADSADTITTQYAAATLRKIATDTWVLVGAIE